LEKGKSRRWRKGAVGDLARCYGVNGALQAVEEITNGIEQQGWAVVAGCLAKEASLRLIQECEEACKNGDFRRAGVGRGKTLEVREDIRRDQVKWLEPGDGAVEQGSYLAWLEDLRLALNQRFFLGLFEFEGHFAIYPEGAFYKPHLDRHAGTSDRIVTVILYLNAAWQPGDGGELKLWTTAGKKDEAFQLIEPRLGTVVCFLAADFWHEVLPAVKTRMSITGWFRQR
jgi:SM-20-related protein